MATTELTAAVFVLQIRLTNRGDADDEPIYFCLATSTTTVYSFCSGVSGQAEMG